jgi:hypothetical protein
MERFLSRAPQAANTVRFGQTRYSGTWAYTYQKLAEFAMKMNEKLRSQHPFDLSGASNDKGSSLVHRVRNLV